MSYETTEGKTLAELKACLEKVYRDYPTYHDPEQGTADFECMVERFAADDFFNLHYVAQEYLKQTHGVADRFVREKVSDAFKTAEDVIKAEHLFPTIWEELIALDDGTRVWTKKKWKRFCIFREPGRITYITVLDEDLYNTELATIVGGCAGLVIEP